MLPVLKELGSSLSGVGAKRSTLLRAGDVGGLQGRPLIVHASTGSTTIFRICMESFGQRRLAFLNTAGWQLYLNTTPASVSCDCTWWIYTSASPSSSLSDFVESSRDVLRL